MARKKKPSVNIDKRVNKYLKDQDVPRARGKRKKPAPDYSDKEVRAFIKKESKGRVTVVSDEKFRRMSDEKKEHHAPMGEARREYIQQRQDWFYRYQPIEGTEYKKKVPGHKTLPSGEKVYKERTRTFVRWRDTVTGRFVSYNNKIIVRDKQTKELKWIDREKPKHISVYEARQEMRREQAIYKIAEKKGITVSEARELFADFEERGMDRYLMKEYAPTP